MTQTLFLRRALLLWLFVVGYCFTPGCRTIEGTWGVPPVYEAYDTPSSVGAGTGTETFFRPFGSYENLTGMGPENPDTDEDLRSLGQHVRILSPFLDFRWGTRGKRYWVLPLFYYRSSPPSPAGTHYSWTLFPFLFGGNNLEHGSYFAFFPLAGKLKGLLGHDEIVFALFPLYWYWAKEERGLERHSTHILLPFFNVAWGGWTGFRFWPFYGHYRAFKDTGEPVYDRKFILWPFYIRQKNQLTFDPTDLLFIAPFYGQSIGHRIQTYTYLWPLFQTSYDRKYDRKTYMGYLFPYRFTTGQTDVWPFYGVKRRESTVRVAGIYNRQYRQFFLWPIQRYTSTSDGLAEDTRLWILPLFWHFYYIEREQMRLRSETKIWPFFRVRQTKSWDDPSIALDLLSPLWFEREDYYRLYSRWFNIFRYRWTPDIYGWELLYGAVMYRAEPEKKEKLFSILGGLFECGSRQDAFVLRLLYVPWW